jgi:hypothetical protein
LEIGRENDEKVLRGLKVSPLFLQFQFKRNKIEKPILICHMSISLLSNPLSQFNRIPAQETKGIKINVRLSSRSISVVINSTPYGTTFV